MVMPLTYIPLQNKIMTKGIERWKEKTRNIDRMRLADRTCACTQERVVMVRITIRIGGR